MVGNTRKILNLIKDTRSNSEFIKMVSGKVRNFMYLTAIAIALAACTAFAGRETAGEYIDDAAITASVKNKILQDSRLKMFQIHVETFQNQVQLSGFVDSSKEVARAGQIAKNVEGVQDVKNNLVVRKRGFKKR